MRTTRSAARLVLVQGEVVPEPNGTAWKFLDDLKGTASYTEIPQRIRDLACRDIPKYTSALAGAATDFFLARDRGFDADYHPAPRTAQLDHLLELGFYSKPEPAGGVERSV